MGEIQKKSPEENKITPTETKETQEVKGEAIKDLEKLKKDITKEQFKATLESLKDTTPEENKQLFLAGILGILNAKGYSLRKTNKDGIEVFQPNEDINLNKDDLESYNAIMTNALSQGIININDINKALLIKSMSGNDFDKESFDGKDLTTSQYFMRVLRKYGLKITVEAGKGLEETNIGEYLKKLSFANEDEYLSFRDSKISEITNINDKEFVRSYLDSMYYNKSEDNRYEDDDIEKLQEQVNNNKEQVNEILDGIDEETKTKLGLNQEGLNDKMSRDPFGTLIEGSKNGGIMYAVIFGILGKIFGGFFKIKHLGKIGAAVGFGAGFTNGTGGISMKDIEGLVNGIGGNIKSGYEEQTPQEIKLGIEQMFNTLQSITDTEVAELKIWLDFKYVKVGDKQIENVNFFELEDIANNDASKLVDNGEKISDEKIGKLKEELQKIKGKLKERNTGLTDKEIKNKFNNQTLSDIIKEIHKPMETKPQAQQEQQETIQPQQQELINILIQNVKEKYSKELVEIKNIDGDIEIGALILLYENNNKYKNLIQTLKEYGISNEKTLSEILK